MIRLLFTSGRGPAECRIAVRKAVAALAAEAASLGLETDCLEGPNADGHGPASAIVIIHGAAAATFAQPWIGAIQWVAQSPLRPHHGSSACPSFRRCRMHRSRSPSRMSALKRSAPAAPAAGTRTRPRARCAPPHRERPLRRGAGGALAASQQSAGAGANGGAAQASG